jgi:hypothetical protein
LAIETAHTASGARAGAAHSETVSESRETQQGDGRGPVPVEPLQCVECGTLSDREARRWRSYRTDDPTEDEPPALAFYCPVCAEREFGQLGPDTGQRNHLS